MTDTDTATVEAHLDLSQNHEAGLIPMATVLFIEALAAERDKLRAENRELQMQMIANDGQAQEAYEAQVALKAENERLRALIAEGEG
jgi:hypothetical protein